MATYGINLHAINISAHPHPPGTYFQLISRVFRKRTPAKIWGERHALMTEIAYTKNKDGERIAAHGTISSFTKIDLNAPWLNSDTGKEADDDETSKIIIPDELRPNFAKFLFYFDFRTHVLSFQGTSRMLMRDGSYKRYSLKPSHLQNYLSAFTSDPDITAGLERVAITVIPHPNSVSDILAHDNIREISIVVSAPNSDNIASLRGQVAGRLRRVNAARVTEKYSANDNVGIKPDTEMKELARVASFDGRVDARVQTVHGVVPISTADRPLEKRVFVDDKTEVEYIRVREELVRIAKNSGA